MKNSIYNLLNPISYLFLRKILILILKVKKTNIVTILQLKMFLFFWIEYFSERGPKNSHIYGM